VVDDDSQLNDKFYPREAPEPLIQSVQKQPRKHQYTKYLSKNKVHEYKIDPMLEYTPEHLQTFRDRRYTHLGHYTNSARHNDLETPKSLLKKSSNSIMSNYSGMDKKTVRFAESREGMLKAVPYDPTFNDSDFVYDMHYRIE
jgi:hypothetical protein